LGVMLFVGNPGGEEQSKIGAFLRRHRLCGFMPLLLKVCFRPAREMPIASSNERKGLRKCAI